MKTNDSVQAPPARRAPSGLAQLGIALALAGLTAACSEAPPPGVSYVRVRPPRAVVEIRTVPPEPGRVWVPGYQRWDGGGYAWVPGRWEAAPTGRQKWVEGRWRSHNGQWYWVEGHWR